MKKILSAAIVIGILCGHANAGTVVCSGTVAELGFHQPGLVFLRLSSMNVPAIICSLNAEWVVPGFGYTGTVSNCKIMYAGLLAAKLSGAAVSQFYFDGDSVPANCASFASWTSVGLRYYNF